MKSSRKEKEPKQPKAARAAARPGRFDMNRFRKWLLGSKDSQGAGKTAIIYLLLICIGFVYLYPVLYMISKSLMNRADLLDSSVSWIPSVLYVKNYIDAFTSMNFVDTFWKSVVVAGLPTLLNLVNTGKTPDCFMILGNCDFALSNDLLGDMTEYWENDPENENILPSINGAKLGYYGTDKKLGTPMKFFPDAIYADMAVFEKLNVTMPDTDWTWEEMIQSFKDVTSPDEGIYGFNQFHSIVTYYPVAADPNCIGEFGWDGESFHMENWAVGVNTLAELMKGKYRAPMTEDEIVAWLGSNEWAGASGKIGYQIDAFWTYLNLFDTDEYRAKGIEMVPYATPSVEGSDSKYKFGVLDFGGISSGTEHPREAYELLKWMGWGADGWKAKVEAYKTLKDEEAGVEIYKQSMPLPLTMDEEVWTEMQTAFFPTLKKAEADQTEKDKKYGKYFDDYFDQVKQGVIPFGDCQIPGFAGFVGADGPYAGVEDSVFNGEKNASDWVTELEEKANEYNRQAMEDAGLE